jgi:hypothetical protein
MPASSKACQTNSNRIRCCGSIWAASRGDIPKKDGSKLSIPSISPAAQV